MDRKKQNLFGKRPKYCLQMETHNPKSPEPFELDGSKDIVVDITNSHDATIPTRNTNNSSVDFILVDYEDPCAKLVTLVDYPESPEEMGDPNLDFALNNITMPHTEKATEGYLQIFSNNAKDK
ncbi:hypothetical protein E2562_039488 [Oryza meyeriana var. granulata]|uniref:Uncharacterized protein n=1 Tax=Oryza meyeriana var. granulata TaxID=110450 RepID=A0A6G1DTQ3_9ORYZ|nr:hypothetical protein E2562_039488 [Oryza meyeriana var. granulata]